MTEGKPEAPNIIFGPVPSRRLEMSLGVDVIPMKVCSYDCIYCELGKASPAYQEEKGNEVVKYVDQLRREHTVRNVAFSGKIYFTLDRDL